MIILLAVASIVSYILWVLIHEMSHFLFAKWFTNAKLLELNVIPRIVDKTIFWASVRWLPERSPPTKNHAALIFLAPRIPNVISLVLTCLLPLLPIDNHLFLLLTVLLGGALVDLINGSLGVSQYSDLKRASSILSISPWVLRIAGFGLAIAASATWLALSLPRLF